MSTTRLLYPKLTPRSVTRIDRLPASASFATACRMSWGAMNCPFLMFTTLPVRAAATSRSVCRDRNAGICSTSATAATIAACAGSWMSVRIGRPVRTFTSSSAARPASSPGPRKERPDVRLALSNEALKITGTWHRAAISLMAIAMLSTCAGLSMTQGPAITASGDPPPIDSGPTRTGGVAAAGVEEGWSTDLPPGGGYAHRGQSAGLVPERRADEAGKQRMRPQRPRLEFGMELHRDEPGMVRHLC